MLVSDPMSGQLHEVPDDPALGWYGWAEADPYGLGYAETEPAVYDGFGDPLGLAPLLAALIPAAASVLPSLLGTLFGRGQPAPGLGLWSPGFAGYAEADDAYGYGYGSQIVYDGFGNPVGSLPALHAALPLLRQAMPVITQALPQVGRVVQQVLPHAQQILQAIAPPPGMPVPPGAGAPLPPPVPMNGPPPPMPPGMEPDEDEMEPEGPPPPPRPYYPPPPPRMMRRRSMRRSSGRGRRGRRF